MSIKERLKRGTKLGFVICDLELVESHALITKKHQF